MSERRSADDVADSMILFVLPINPVLRYPVALGPGSWTGP